MKLLIVGGNGLIGGSIARASADAGYEVSIVGTKVHDHDDANYTYYAGNWSDDSFALKVVSCCDYDVIVDCLIFDEYQMRRSAYICNGHCKHFIYISTDSVYEHPNRMLSEQQIINDKKVHWNYGINKRQAELYLSDHSENYSFNWTVIRPTITFGNTRIPVGFAGKRNTYNLCQRILDNKPVIRFDDPETKHSICHVSVFGAAVRELYLNEDSYGRYFHISDDISYTYGEVFASLEQILGKRGNYVYMPADALSKVDRGLYEDMIYDKNPEFTLDNSAIKRLCKSVSFHVDLTDVLKETVNHLALQKQSNDDNYDLLTDYLLVKYNGTISNAECVPLVRDYLSSMSDDYRKTVLKYRVPASRLSLYRRIRILLGRFKRKMKGLY